MRLEELHRCVVEELVEAELACGRHRDRLASLSKLVSEEPLRERRWALLMVALYRSGQQAEALRAFQRANAALGDLGLMLGPELVSLERAISAGDLSLGPETLGWLSSAGGTPPRTTLAPSLGNLPVPLTSFVGREVERARVTDALAISRVVTLTGVGGVGKTRLALQVAGEVAPRFPDGVWLCELASVRDHDRVVEAVAAVLGVSASPDSTREESLIAYLGDKHLLLLIDNCEHLLRSAARLVVAIEGACPQARVLATSREGLNIGGEQLLIVPALGLPADGSMIEASGECEAVHLFADRAAAVKAGFAVDRTNRADVVSICTRLDGMALAIELAAARIQAMNPAELARRLDQRFRLLSGGNRVAVERHQTLRATIDWSYDLLSEPHQRLLARLSVFVGGCTLDAAEEVCAGDPIEPGDVFELLAGLVARSLVVADDTGPDTRYRLLETIRQYAEERLEPAERIQLRERHVGCYVSFVEAVARGTCGPDQLRWIRQAEPELDNLRAAMAWTLANDDAVNAERFLSSADDVERGPITAAVLHDAEAVLALPDIHTIERYPFALMRVRWQPWSAASSPGPTSSAHRHSTQPPHRTTSSRARRQSCAPSAHSVEATRVERSSTSR